ncbi:MAG: crossover junction endodeoxyribonuclease RuvC [Gemmatimonadetes bacterium]|nr:crossover junction endodeoxyribonuclease RuvC [Gemmatimonadota bacterium]
MIVLGVDPGTTATGYGVVERPEAGPYRLVECGVIRPPAKRPLAGKLDAIFTELEGLIARHRPSALAVENVFVARNARSALVLGHARGVILLAAQQAGLPVHEMPPAVIKKAVVGTGNASKEQVQFMVARLLRLKKAPEPADAADGVAAALACCLAPTLPTIAEANAAPRGRVVRA